MKFQTLLNIFLSVTCIVLAGLLVSHHQRLQLMERVVRDGAINARSIVARQIMIVNPNGHEVIRLESNWQDSSGYGDGIILVNEGQGLQNDVDKLKASVQIRASAQLGGMVAAQSHRFFKQTKEGLIKLEPIHDVPPNADPKTQE